MYKQEYINFREVWGYLNNLFIHRLEYRLTLRCHIQFLQLISSFSKHIIENSTCYSLRFTSLPNSRFIVRCVSECDIVDFCSRICYNEGRGFAPTLVNQWLVNCRFAWIDMYPAIVYPRLRPNLIATYTSPIYQASKY